ncbi:MAG: glycosyltransferase family 9 protein [Acidobacteria bacterium]|nr:glycosyltransferase family 9 protein [Acidobacteriota bacterium]
MPKDQKPKAEDLIDWMHVRRVLVVRLRSIGDTVLATPSLTALRRFLPDAQIDVLLEDWVAPVLETFDAVDNVITVGKSTSERIKIARYLRKQRYDVAFNLHGGTTATLFTFASGAKRRVGFADYQYPFLYTDLLSSSADFWGRSPTHSAEQQLALIGSMGVPVDDLPKTSLAVTDKALASVEEKLTAETGDKRQETRDGRQAAENTSFESLSSLESLTSNAKEQKPRSAFALLHPAAAFAEKQWATEKFARVAEFLIQKGMQTVAVAAPNESQILQNLTAEANVPVITFDNLTLPEITALASRASLFVGNDSGIAHIAAAVKTPVVVIFGSSNIDHWRPWTDAPNEIVFSDKPCTHYKGETNKGLPDPKCIKCVEVKDVAASINKILKSSEI